MKKIITLSVMMLMAVWGVVAQSLSANDMIAITPIVSDQLDVPAGVRQVLETKARQMLTSNGMASTSQRIALTANITVLSKDVTPTAPPIFDISMEISFYVVDVVEQTIISEITYPQKGIDKQEHKAMIKAINRINPRSPEVSRFIADTKQRLADYYKMRLPALMKEADALAAQGAFDEALALLSGVPSSVEGYDAVADKTVAIYKQYANREADFQLNEANGYIAVRNYEAAVEALIQVDPLSDRYSKATALVNKIKSSIDASERAAIAAQMERYEAKQEQEQRLHDDDVALKKMAIQACQNIAVAQSEANKPSMMTKIGNWFTAKFKSL